MRNGTNLARHKASTSYSTKPIWNGRLVQWEKNEFIRFAALHLQKFSLNTFQWINVSRHNSTQWWWKLNFNSIGKMYKNAKIEMDFILWCIVNGFSMLHSYYVNTIFGQTTTTNAQHFVLKECSFFLLLLASKKLARKIVVELKLQNKSQLIMHHKRLT